MSCGSSQPVVYWSGGKDSTSLLLAYRVATGEEPIAVGGYVPGNANLAQIVRLARVIGLDPVVCPAGRCPAPSPGMAIITYRPGATLWELIRKYGYPLDRVGHKRWCCEKFKTEPVSEIPHDCAISGASDADSTVRRMRYRDLDPEMPVREYDGVRVLCPLYGLPKGVTWNLLRHYSEDVWREVARWYVHHTHSPDCVLCILAGKRAVMATAAAEPQLARIAETVLSELVSRYREGTRSRERVSETLESIRVALSRRL